MRLHFINKIIWIFQSVILKYNTVIMLIRKMNEYEMFSYAQKVLLLNLKKKMHSKFRPNNICNSS